MKAKNKNIKIKKRIIAVVFAIGFMVAVYPATSNYLATSRFVSMAEEYDMQTASLTQKEIEGEWQKAIEYNNSLLGTPVKDPFMEGSGWALPANYTGVLNTNGIMGYIEIPSLGLKLPIYHGTSEEVLKKGIGHVEVTTLPIGGQGGHCVLTGHTGLPTAKLFTDLIDLKEEEYFYLEVLGQKLAYKVDQILVVEPEDISQITSSPNKDYVTLVTCTPYGVNSHRLLVRGERSYYMNKNEYLAQTDTVLWKFAAILAGVVACICFAGLLVRRKKKKKCLK